MGKPKIIHYRRDSREFELAASIVSTKQRVLLQISRDGDFIIDSRKIANIGKIKSIATI